MSDKRERIGFIDTAKGIAMLLVVLSHTGAFPWYIGAVVGAFYMSLFFCLSGMTFTNCADYTWAMVRKRSKKLLSAYLKYACIATGSFFLINKIWCINRQISWLNQISGIVYARYYLFPALSKNNIQLLNSCNSALWFLPAMVLVVVGYRLLPCSVFSNQKYFVYYACGSIILTAFMKKLPILLPWSLDTVFLSLLFVCIGKIFAEKLKKEKSKATICLLSVALLLLSILNRGVNYSVREFGKSVTVFVFTSIIGTYLTVQLAKWINRRCIIIDRFLRFIGKNTLLILGVHLIFVTVFDALVVVDENNLFLKIFIGVLNAICSIALCSAIIVIIHRGKIYGKKN